MKSWDEGPYDPVKHKPWGVKDRVLFASYVTMVMTGIALLMKVIFNV